VKHPNPRGNFGDERVEPVEVPRVDVGSNRRERGMNVLADAALDYARQDWPVLPCRGKVPITAHGVKDATTDLVVIESWWRRWPNASVAVATGAPGPTVIDLDGPDAIRAWKQLMNGARVQTPVSRTARGLHVWFTASDLPCSVSRLGPHIDVRGRGGFVIAPPSKHASGVHYTWLVSPHG
jgi:hypothetical protein